MRFKQYGLLLLLVSVNVIVCVDLEIDSSTEVLLISEEVETTEADVLRVENSCISDADCHHLGTCKPSSDGTSKSCSCKNGTSGSFCETVDECANDKDFCGTTDDVSCVYDSDKEKAVCKCDNETKTYVWDEERCMSPCNDRGCGNNGLCALQIGKQWFCACKLGASGDFCEIIDKCEDKSVDCGVDNNATCVLGGKGKVYCKCEDTTKGFDYDAKMCKDCSGCGEKILRPNSCVFRNGSRTCSCGGRYGNNNGICEDCKCGPDAYGCTFGNGAKTCQCNSGAAPKDGLCQLCNCGSSWRVAKCEFGKEGKKVCTCKEGYTLDGTGGTCKQTCSATTPCQNKGKCVQNTCQCPKGTSGDLCQSINGCREKCGFVKCLFNETSQEPYCQCDGKTAFDDSGLYKRCRECDCGTYGKGCKFVRGKKVCDCEGVYEDKLGTCTLCFCKGYASMYGCKFDDSGSIKCNCSKGFAQKGDECRECDCGDHGKCEFIYFSSKACTCDQGYVQKDGKCQACDCGTNGRCYFVGGEPKCSCNAGYLEYGGTCRECQCGMNAKCGFTSWGQKECKCNENYGLKDGECKVCNCHPGTSCRFAPYNPYSSEKKTCICPDKYADDSGQCRECDCGMVNSTCTFFSGFMSCRCPPGYAEVNKEYSFIRKVCKDIDECKGYSYRCPSTTNCVNTPGSYECECKDGYEKFVSKDIKTFGCDDINECVRDLKPCNDADAYCVNTQGSYECRCTQGYTLRKATRPKDNTCGTETRPWRIASIVVGVISSVIIIGLLVGVGQKYRWCE